MKPITIALSSLVLAVLSSGCHRSRSYEAQVEIERMTVARKDEAGKPLIVDIEISYAECPGEQLEVIRSGAEFADCMSKAKVGDKVPAKIKQRWDPEGYWRYDVIELAGCPRTLDPHDEGSFTSIRECEDWTVNGAVVGFQCNVAPQKTLIKKCPWFAKH